MKSLHKQRLIAAFIILVLIGIGVEYGYYLFNKPRSSVVSSSTDLQIDAKALFHDFETNDSLASSRYLNKVIEVKGMVQAIDSSAGNIAVFLATGSAGLINCAMAGNTVPVQEKKEILIKGRCAGYMLDVIMVDCVIP